MSLADFLGEYAPTSRNLGLLHCTPVLHGVQAIADQELAARPCTVYGGTPMVYLFYGRPAFKPLSGFDASGIREHLPMCLVLDPALLGQAVRILPFDSGGFGRYAPFTAPFERDAFELAPANDVPRRIVAAFYETSLSYYHQLPALDEQDISLRHPEARAIARLAHDVGMADDDDRRGTIEIQLEENVDVVQALKAMVIPPFMLDEPDVAHLIAASGAMPITYDTYGRQRPGSYSGILYDRVL